MSITVNDSTSRARAVAIGWQDGALDQSAKQWLSAVVAKLGTTARNLIWPILAGLSLPLVVLIAWSLAVHYELLAPQILPAPSLVWTTTSELLLSGDLISELGVSMARLFVGLLIGCTLGFVFGVAFATSRALDSY